MNKPVWRLNSGLGMPSDKSNDGVLFSDGDLIFNTPICKQFFDYPEQWTLDGDYYIIAYQTNRTRKAKYELVECGYCEGMGVLFHKEESNNNLKCYCCNGKGYRLERVE